MITTDAIGRYVAKGFTDDVTACEICGKPELKGTVRLVILDADGNEDGEVYAGVVCAAKRAGRKATEIRTEAVRADRERTEAIRAAFWAWRSAHSDWYVAGWTSALGNNPGFAAIRAWDATPEHQDAEMAWLAEHPEPQRPW